jgi:hypothetical protein
MNYIELFVWIAVKSQLALNDEYCALTAVDSNGRKQSNILLEGSLFEAA